MNHYLRGAIGLVIAVAQSAQPYRAQAQPGGDQFNAITDCEQVYRQTMEKVSEERTRSEAQYQKDVIDCSNSNRGCIQKAQNDRLARERTISKESVDASAERSTCQERARLAAAAVGAAIGGALAAVAFPLPDAALQGLGEEILKRLVPGPSDANPIGWDYLRKIAFLKLAPTTRDYLVNEFNRTIMKMDALKKRKGKLSAADQQENARLAGYANFIQHLGRQLRTTYDEIKNSLGAEGQGYPDSASLNIPW